MFQSGTEIGLDSIGLDTSNSTNMISILPRTAKEEHQLSVSVSPPRNVNVNVNDNQPGRCVQTVVFISEENLPGKGDITNELEMEGRCTDTAREECTISPILLT